MGGRMKHLVVAAAILALPSVSHTQDYVNPPPPTTPLDSGPAFLLSARMLTPWILTGGDVEDVLLLSLLPISSVPRFVLGAQFGAFGVGLGANYFTVTSEREDSYYYGGGGGGGGTETTTVTTSIFLLGPTVTYRVLASPTGTAQLHLVASFVYGSGGSEEEFDGETTKGPDTTALGVNGGVMGRAMLVEGFGLDAGVGLDYTLLSADDNENDTKSSTGVIQMIGFVGATFLLSGV